MKTQGLQHTLFSKIPLMAVSILFYSNCYFNPAIQSVINPATSESGGAGALALLAGGGSSIAGASFQVSGQLKSNNTNLTNANLTVVSSGATSVRFTPISTSTTTNGIGKFLLQLPVGKTIVSVSSSGVNTTNFELSISSDGVATLSSNATPFTISSLSSHPLGTVVDLTTEEITSPTFFLVSSIPANGTTNAIVNQNFQTDVTLVFNKTIDITTITTGSVTTASGPTITVFGGQQNGTTALFRMNTVFVNTVYSFSLSSAIKDLDGNSLTPQTITFTTISNYL